MLRHPYDPELSTTENLRRNGYESRSAPRGQTMLRDGVAVFWSANVLETNAWLRAGCPPQDALPVVARPDSLELQALKKAAVIETGSEGARARAALEALERRGFEVRGSLAAGRVVGRSRRCA